MNSDLETFYWLLALGAASFFLTLLLLKIFTGPAY